MTQQQINRAVAQRTGEDINEIRRRGFTIADPHETAFDPEPNDLPPQMVDWDDLELTRNIAVYDAPCRL
jgi:hypothetical protein